MRWMAIAAALAVGCGGGGGDAARAPERLPGSASAGFDRLGVPCTPGTSTECGTAGGVVCGNDRFGWTCVAYCPSAACAGAECFPRIDPPDAPIAYAGFCWQPCAADADCKSGLRCHPEGICGP